MADLYSSPINEIRYVDLEAFARSGEPPVEGERLDFKETLNDRVIQTIVAMANTEGGIVLIGVGEIEDQGRGTKRMKWPPDGVESPSIQDALGSMCHAVVRPNYSPEAKLIDVPDVAGKYVLVVRVNLRRCPRPLWHEQHGVLVRVGDQNRPADLETLRGLFLEPARVSESETLYQEHRGLLRMGGGDTPCLSVVALYPEGAPAFETREKVSVGRLAAKYFDFDPTHMEVSSRRTYAEIKSPASPEGRTIVARVSAEGVVTLEHYQEFTRIAWDWILGETYLALLCLKDPVMATVFPVIDQFTATITLANWSERGISMERLLASGSAIVPPGRLAPVQEEWEIFLESDLWETAKNFLRIILAEAGALYYEDHVAHLSRDSFFNTYFTPDGPYHRGTWT